MRGTAPGPARASTPPARAGGRSAHPRPPLPQGPYAVVGLARSGSAAASALLRTGERVVGLDSSLPGSVEQLRKAGVVVLTGERAFVLPDDVRTVVKSPGVPDDAAPIAQARERGLALIGELELGWRLLANEFIAVTGTNGKTTTAELIGHIHRQAGAPAIVAGNVGTALSALVGQADDAQTIICEASSFQLADSEAFAPEAAVLVNLAPDHLDRHGSFAAYVAAKARVFERQGDGDMAVLPFSLAARGAAAASDADGAAGAQIAALAGAGQARRVCFGEEREADLWQSGTELRWRGEHLIALGELALPGRHNVENAMAAAAACLARGIEPDAVREGLRSFAGVRHRLEQVCSRGGVTFVNDSKATNVASTLVALQALADTGGVHLILGGQGKGQDFTPLREPVSTTCRGVYLVGEDAAQIAAALAGVEVPLRMCGELERAVAQAAHDARAGEVVLLSPAAASFDQFRDFEARGDRFRELACG